MEKTDIKMSGYAANCLDGREILFCVLFVIFFFCLI